MASKFVYYFTSTDCSSNCQMPLFSAESALKTAPKLATLSQAVNSLLFGVSVVAAILALLSLLRVTVFILEISGETFSTT
jgi:hypothetical protein